MRPGLSRSLLFIVALHIVAAVHAQYGIITDRDGSLLKAFQKETVKSCAIRYPCGGEEPGVEAFINSHHFTIRSGGASDGICGFGSELVNGQARPPMTGVAAIHRTSPHALQHPYTSRCVGAMGAHVLELEQ